MVLAIAILDGAPVRMLMSALGTNFSRYTMLRGVRICTGRTMHAIVMWYRLLERAPVSGTNFYRPARDYMLGGVHHVNRTSTFIVTAIATVLDIAQIGVQTTNTLWTNFCNLLTRQVNGPHCACYMYSAKKVGMNAVGTNFYKVPTMILPCVSWDAMLGGIHRMNIHLFIPICGILDGVQVGVQHIWNKFLYTV